MSVAMPPVTRCCEPLVVNETLNDVKQDETRVRLFGQREGVCQCTCGRVREFGGTQDGLVHQ